MANFDRRPIEGYEQLSDGEPIQLPQKRLPFNYGQNSSSCMRTVMR